MIIGRRSFLTGLGALLAAPAIVHAGNLMPIRVKLTRHFAPAQYDLIVMRGRNEFGQLIEEKFFDTSEESIQKHLASYSDVTDVRKLQSIARPWATKVYDLRADILASFKEHGI